MRYRPIRKNYDNEVYGDIDYLERLERYCTYLENKEKQLIIGGVMPRKLTAENGAKALLIGEFAEAFDPDNCGNPYVVPISWDSIKNIYKRIVEHYVA